MRKKEREKNNSSNRNKLNQQIMVIGLAAAGFSAAKILPAIGGAALKVKFTD